MYTDGAKTDRDDDDDDDEDDGNMERRVGESTKDQKSRVRYQ